VRSWLRWLTLSISLLPVLAFLAIIASTFVQSWPALQQIGPQRLFGSQLASPMSQTTRVQWGLLAPIWGTFIVALLGMLIALPTVVCFAILAREFRIRGLSNIINTLLGALGGIPPVIYALMSIFFVEAFMRAKLAAWDVSDLRMRALLQGLPRFDQDAVPVQLPNSSILAGLLIGLLIIPFMAPLVDDAFRSVPQDLKQGSFALGATRWQTLWRIVLPHALPGIVAAVALGTLVGVGEILIPSFVLGGGESIVNLPQPLLNVLTHTPSLSSVGVSMYGALSLGETEGIQSLQTSMAYVSSLFLLIFALLVMGAETLVQHVLQRNRR
jgi:phosphate transport system permease protein